MTFKILPVKVDPQYEYVRESIRQLIKECEAGKVITDEIYQDIFKQHGLNSYEREALAPFFDPALLIKEVQYCIKNCRSKYHPNRPRSTYDEAVVHHYAPLLIKAIEKLVEESKPKTTEYPKAEYGTVGNLTQLCQSLGAPVRVMDISGEGSNYPSAAQDARDWKFFGG